MSNNNRARPLILVAILVVLAGVAGSAGVWWGLIHRVQGQFFDAGGVRLHYTDEGSGAPVVLLHGFAVNADLNWRLPGLTAALSDEFRVIAMDLRGHGLSDKPHEAEHYGMAMAEDAVALLDHLEIERAHLVGYSLGGIIALKLATTHPDRLITVSALGAGWEDPDDSQFLAAMDGIADALESGRGIPPLSASLGGEREKPSLLHTMWVKLVTGYLNDGRALAAMVRGINGLTFDEKALTMIPTPVCSIVGDRDSMKLGVDAMVGRVADHTVVYVEGADHLQATRSPVLAGSLLAFLRTHSE